MNTRTRETLTGAAALAVVLAAVMLLSGETRPGGAGADGYRVTVPFGRIDGLFPGDEVTLSGILAGTVETAVLNERYQAVVTLRINADIELPDDTSAAIHTDGLFGSKYIVLEPGGSEDLLKDGSTIEFAQDAMIVSELLDLIIAEGHAAQAEARAQKAE
ncbi:MAG: MlaD family protein [Rhodospirillales bacterium]